jgi:hypothetical protein
VGSYLHSCPQGKKKKKVATDPASKVGVSIEFKAQSDAEKLETIMRNQSELGAAVELVGATPANLATLRVRAVGSLATCGNLMLGGGTLLDHETSEPKVQWFRSKHGVVVSAGQSGVDAEGFEPVPRARSLSYTPSALDAGRLLRLVVSPGQGHDTVWAPASEAAVSADEKVVTNAKARVESVRATPPCTADTPLDDCIASPVRWDGSCYARRPAQGARDRGPAACARPPAVTHSMCAKPAAWCGFCLFVSTGRGA